MAEKVSLKIFIVISFLCGILSACMAPIDIQVFLDDPQVQVIIESVKKPPPSVKIGTGSDSGLIAGDGKISGLIEGKYYKIEVMENDVPLKTYFLGAKGTRNEELKEIRKVTVREITGLTNDVTYRLKSAELYTNSDNKIKYFAITDESPKDSALITNGTVTIFEKRQSQQPATKCYFNIAPIINVTKDYKVMRIGTETETWQQERISSVRKADSPDTFASIISNDYEKSIINNILLYGIYMHDRDILEISTPPFLNNMSIMELPAVGTENNDYVFVEYKTSDVTGDFYVLTVNVKPPSGDSNITITSPTIPTEQLTSPTGDIISISRSDSEVMRTITATATGGSSYKWFYDDNKPISDIPTITTSSEETIVIGAATLLGNYSITVEVTVKNVVYSKRFILRITN